VSFPPPPDAARLRRLVRRLVDWYRAERRDLPWRRTRDAYAIWISEAMLQQTRVEVVVDYWARFLARFPTARDLAAASEEDVLAQWSGLGYYRRARALRAAARVIVRDHGGELPRARSALLALPGVGPYTAGAVLSIAFDAPEPLVDGNVERVFARLFALDAATGSAALKAECWALARRCVPRSGAGEWNQALMELGATICTPRAPGCPACPLRRACRALRAGRVEALPRPKAQPARLDVELDIVVAEDAGRWLLVQRAADAGRMAGMWEFPTRERTRHALFAAAWTPGAALEPDEELFELRHAITRHHIRARVQRAPAPAAIRAPYRWTTPARSRALPLTGMARKVVRKLGAAVDNL
jgi:A/G-specific adenine glycosylase